MPVRLCLAALPGERIETVERVYSHVQALGQAERFLRTRPWSLLATAKDDDAARQEFVDLLELLGAEDPRTAGWRRRLTNRLF